MTAEHIRAGGSQPQQLALMRHLHDLPGILGHQLFAMFEIYYCIEGNIPVLAEDLANTVCCVYDTYFNPNIYRDVYSAQSPIFVNQKYSLPYITATKKLRQNGISLLANYVNHAKIKIWHTSLDHLRPVWDLFCKQLAGMQWSNGHASAKQSEIGRDDLVMTFANVMGARGQIFQQ